MTVRKATERDLSAVGALLLQVARLHAEGRPDIFRAGRRKYTDEELLSIFADPMTPVYLAEEEGEVLGYVFCIVEETKDSYLLLDRKTLYIDDLCIDAAHRGKGIGTVLYYFAKEEAIRLGCDSVTLNVWSFNESALAFYRKLGMKPLKTVMEDSLC